MAFDSSNNPDYMSYNYPAVDVYQFHTTFGHPIRNRPTLDVPDVALRRSLIEEEYIEFKEALESNDVIEVADALGDLVYVIYGAAYTFGIDLGAVLSEIHASNMSKIGVDGKPIYRTDGKVLKGPNYFEPNIAKAIGLDDSTDEE